jgi:hypothetical protein
LAIVARSCGQVGAEAPPQHRSAVPAGRSQSGPRLGLYSPSGRCPWNLGGRGWPAWPSPKTATPTGYLTGQGRGWRNAPTPRQCRGAPQERPCPHLLCSASVAPRPCITRDATSGGRFDWHRISQTGTAANRPRPKSGRVECQWFRAGRAPDGRLLTRLSSSGSDSFCRAPRPRNGRVQTVALLLPPEFRGRGKRGARVDQQIQDLSLQRMHHRCATRRPRGGQGRRRELVRCRLVGDQPECSELVRHSLTTSSLRATWAASDARAV